MYLFLFREVIANLKKLHAIMVHKQHGKVHVFLHGNVLKATYNVDSLNSRYIHLHAMHYYNNVIFNNEIHEII